MAAYAYHAFRLGKKDEKVFEFVEEGLASTLNKSLGVNDFIGLVLKCGEINIRAMELLDAGNTEIYGHPVPTKVLLSVKKGKAILVSGHDLKDLEEILKQTEVGHHGVYTRRDVAGTRLSGVEKVQALMWALWHGVAEPAARVCNVSGRDTDDYELHSEAAGGLQGQYIYKWTSRVARCHTHRKR